MKDTTMFLIQLSCVGIGVLFLYLGAFVFMNKAQVQYVLPSVITGIFISVIPTFLLPLIFDVQTGGVKQ